MPTTLPQSALRTMVAIGDHSDCDPADSPTCTLWDECAEVVISATTYGAAIWDDLIVVSLSRGSHAFPWHVTIHGETIESTRCSDLQTAAEVWAATIDARRVS